MMTKIQELNMSKLPSVVLVSASGNMLRKFILKDKEQAKKISKLQIDCNFYHK